MKVVILDALSIRQLKRRPRPGEAEDIFAIAVALDLGIRYPKVGPNAFLGKRMSLQRSLRLAPYQLDLEDPPRPHRHLGDDKLPEEAHYQIFKKGLVLHDFDSPLFGSVPKVAPAIAEVLSLKPHLPSEIRQLIVDFMPHVDIEDATAAPAELQEKSGVIDLIGISPLSAAERLKAMTDLQSAYALNSSEQVVMRLHAWRGTRTTARTDIWHLLQRQQLGPNSTQRLLMFDLHIWESERKIIVVQRSDTTPLVVAFKQSITDARRELTQRTIRAPKAQDLLDQSADYMEVLRPPSSPFYNEMYFEHYINETVLYSNIPIFALTDTLTDEDIEQLPPMGLAWNDHFSLPERLVPWQSETDATLKDTFDFVVSMYLGRPYSPLPAPPLCFRTTICIDSATPIDHCVLLIKFYWRCDRQAHPDGRWDRWQCLGCRMKRVGIDGLGSQYSLLLDERISFSDVAGPDVECYVPPNKYGENAKSALRFMLGPFLHSNGL